MREIRTLRVMRRELETGLRKKNISALPRQFPTLPGSAASTPPRDACSLNSRSFVACKERHAPAPVGVEPVF